MPVERERFPAPAFGGPRGFPTGGFRGGLRGRFPDGFGHPPLAMIVVEGVQCF
jgi:hypothetical protein